MSRIANTSVSGRQGQILELMCKLHRGVMSASVENYRQIADIIGWKAYGGVRDCLYALRAKGAVTSTGRSQTKPDQWLVVEGREAP